ncbi:MAG: HAMP domain-containing protein [Parvularculaceae bacterium]|nr:MAG: HAMP domain-containing protein [Parvularculaceae bacterium]
MGKGEGKGKGTRKRSVAPQFAISRLTFTIASANLVGLLIVLIGSFAVTEYRDSLILAKLEGVRAQSQIVADVLAQTAIDENACEPIDQFVSTGVGITQSSKITVCARNLSDENVRGVFNRTWDSFEGRIRIFNAPQDGASIITDANSLLLDDVVLRQDRIELEKLPPIQDVSAENAQWAIVAAAQGIMRRFMTGPFRRAAAQRTIEQELNEAIASPVNGENRGWAGVRLNEDGELVASVSIPIRRLHAVYGVVTSEIGGIEELVGKSRTAILPFFGLAIAAAVLSSLFLTTAIAQPIRALAVAADQVREGITAAGRARIPDFTNRRDEIGELSVSLRTMTKAIYERIEAIESFAADVSHELKNPLTSIRSATETLEIVKTAEAREKLMDVIQKDVARMDRLITDISNASRLDAELAREERAAVDLSQLLRDVVDTYQVTHNGDQAEVRLLDTVGPNYVFGNAAALGQVFRNLIDNAQSFSPTGSVVDVAMSLVDRGARAVITVDDKGPGVPDEALEKIFERFYTKRPAGAAFGNNSGLGLAICRQIVASHGGAVFAENRLTLAGENDGARFIVELPIVGW